MGKAVLMQGNEACVEGALAAGMRLFAGYPITPSTEIAENCAVRLPMAGGTFIQMEDEIASIAAVIGASAAGTKAMTATSGPGFSLKQENIGYACLAEIPCVVVDVQRSGPSTGLPTSPSQGDVMQARWGTHGDHPVIAVSPSSVKETYELIIRCFNLSEKYRTPVIFLMDEMIAHLREAVELPDIDSLEIEDRITPPAAEKNPFPYLVNEGEWVPRLMPLGMGQHYHITGLIHDDTGFPTNSHEEADKLCRRLFDKIQKNKEEIITYDEYLLEDAEEVVVCYGGTARAALSAVDEAREKGIKVGMFRLITIWPFPEEQIFRLADKTRRILVAEHNDGQILLEVRRSAQGKVPVDFIGKINGDVITPEELLTKIEEERYAKCADKK